MKCNYCGHIDSKVIDSRTSDDFLRIRRRRECLKCGRRFTTYEVIDGAPSLLVAKTDGTRQPFDSDKIKRGLLKACEKRPVSMQEIDEMVAAIEREVLLCGEVSSKRIGELVMNELRFKDRVAYIRFASVYLDFKDLESFTKHIEDISK